MEKPSTKVRKGEKKPGGGPAAADATKKGVGLDSKMKIETAIPTSVKSVASASKKGAGLDSKKKTVSFKGACVTKKCAGFDSKIKAAILDSAKSLTSAAKKVIGLASNNKKAACLVSKEKAASATKKGAGLDPKKKKKTVSLVSKGKAASATKNGAGLASKQKAGVGAPCKRKALAVRRGLGKQKSRPSVAPHLAKTGAAAEDKKKAAAVAAMAEAVAKAEALIANIMATHFIPSAEEIIEALHLRPDDFNQAYDVVYTAEGTRTRRRGSEEFVWPAGWKKFALNVSPPKYNRRDRDGREWLHKRDGWPVAFHGTTGGDRHVIKDIVRNGLKVRGGSSSARNGEVFGSGIYCTPDPEFAAEYAAREPWEADTGYGSRRIEVVFQVRVRPGAFREHHHKRGRCWVVGSSRDVRPCGILLREQR